jgi:hypothetical protein
MLTPGNGRPQLAVTTATRYKVPAGTFQAVADAVKAAQPLVIDLLYGDFEGGQRVITQFSLRPANKRWLAQATMHFNVDRPDPR